jgi:pilus assembly protein Flp/PilA
MKQVVAAAKRLRDLALARYLGVKEFLTKREEGASLVEYALLVALIALACIAAIQFLGGGIANAFNNIANRLNGAIGG